MRGRKAPSLGSIPPLPAASPLTPRGEATQQYLPAGKSLRDLMSVGPRWGCSHSVSCLCTHLVAIRGTFLCPQNLDPDQAEELENQALLPDLQEK